MITTLAELATFEQEVKRSRFIARACRVQSPDEALAFVAQVREPKANHNCWAWRIGQEHRFSDDGEPGGSAGRPMLQAIDGQGLDQVVVVVTRYFGGIKLGTGGMIRAYHGTAAACLRDAKRLEIRPRSVLIVQVPFADVGALWQLVERFEASREQERYGAEGLTLELSVDAAQVHALTAELVDATAGRAVVRSEGQP